MANLKTSPNEADVKAFIEAIEEESKKKDAEFLLTFMEELTGQAPKMWGSSIIGFGSYHYKYESGREGEWFLTGFSPRKRELTLYIMSGFESFESLLAQLGKHRIGKGCLYIKRINDIDKEVLQELVLASIAILKERYKPEN